MFISRNVRFYHWTPSSARYLPECLLNISVLFFCAFRKITTKTLKIIYGKVLTWNNKFYVLEQKHRDIIYSEQGRIQDLKLGGGTLKKIVPSGGRREIFWGISCEKSRFYDKKIIFFSNFRGARAPYWIRPWWVSEWLLSKACSAIFQLYHGANKFIFSEMMMRSALY